jgi:hypothetical protein
VPNSVGSLAMLLAIHRASSIVSTLAVATKSLSCFHPILSYGPFLAMVHFSSKVGRCVMNEDLTRIQQRARELARSGKFFGARAVAFELQFEPGYSHGLRWIDSPEVQEELDLLCKEARTGIRRSDPEAA